MFTFLTDEKTGDWDLSTGKLKMTDNNVDLVAQKVDIRWNTWRGEWGFDLNFGIPYTQRILNSSIQDRGNVDAEFIRQVTEITQVDRVVDLSSSLDPVNRVYRMDNLTVYVDDEEVTIPVSTPNDAQYDYPEPSEQEEYSVCTLSPEEVDYINKLYYLMNYQLKEGASHTWYNTWRDSKYQLTIEDANDLYKAVEIDLTDETTWENLWVKGATQEVIDAANNYFRTVHIDLANDKTWDNRWD